MSVKEALMNSIIYWVGMVFNERRRYRGASLTSRAYIGAPVRIISVDLLQDLVPA